MITVAITVIFLFILILVGCPVFISLGASGVLGFLLVGGIENISSLPLMMYSQIDSFVLVAVPLFIFMGEILAKTGLGVSLFDCFSKWTTRIPGGLAVSSIMSCAVFGAACGVSVAGVGAIGPLAVPEMLKKGYSPRISSGSVAASGALATLIPPSIVMIVYGSISFVSVEKLFIGGVVPGIVLAIAMSLYIIIVTKVWPSLAPAEKIKYNWSDKIRSSVRTIPVFLLTAFILVSLYTGIATPTEVGAVGVVLAIVIARFVYKSFNIPVFLETLKNSTRSTIAVCVIVASSMCFGNFLNLMRVPDIISSSAASAALPPVAVVLLFMFLLIVLGMFIDGISLIVITTPILLPTILAMGLDPLWYGIILSLNIEMAVISPPVGLNLYMMKGVVPSLSLDDVIMGALPFLGVQFLCLLLFIFVPQLALWLPNLMSG